MDLAAQFPAPASPCFSVGGRQGTSAAAGTEGMNEGVGTALPGTAKYNCVQEHIDLGSVEVPVVNSIKGESRKDLPLLCIVENCGCPLTEAQDYYQRHRICKPHLLSPVLLVNDELKRFCQRCGKFEPLGFFDGTKKSCRSQLRSHNKRRRTSAKSSLDYPQRQSELSSDDERDLRKDQHMEPASGEALSQVSIPQPARPKAGATSSCVSLTNILQLILGQSQQSAMPSSANRNTVEQHIRSLGGADSIPLPSVATLAAASMNTVARVELIESLRRNKVVIEDYIQLLESMDSNAFHAPLQVVGRRSAFVPTIPAGTGNGMLLPKPQPSLSHPSSSDRCYPFMEGIRNDLMKKSHTAPNPMVLPIKVSEPAQDALVTALMQMSHQSGLS